MNQDLNTIIESNKEQFTEKELEKINKKLVNIIPSNAKQLYFNEDSNLNEYNGYTPFSKEKIFNMILFFSEGKILKTKLLKEMFYADFIYYKNTCKSITGLEYAKLPFGPVPDEFETILYDCANKKIINYDIDFENQYECHNISAIKKFDKSIFTKDELDTLVKIKNKFKSYCSKDIVDFSHKEKAFKEPNFGDKISYDYAFDIESI